MSTARSNSSMLVGSGVGLEMTIGVDVFCSTTVGIEGFVVGGRSVDNLGNGGAGTDITSLLPADVVDFEMDNGVAKAKTNHLY